MVSIAKAQRNLPISFSVNYHLQNTIDVINKSISSIVSSEQQYIKYYICHQGWKKLYGLMITTTIIIIIIFIIFIALLPYKHMK